VPSFIPHELQIFYRHQKGDVKSSRTPLEECFYDDMKYEEMAKILGTSVGALKASYHHAVKKIEKYITEH
jgi:DNA-directed RNA polymerase specialized sigma24 family protein